MKNLKRIFSLLCLSAMVTLGKVDARNIPMIAGTVSVLLGMFNFSLGFHDHQIIDPTLSEEKRKGARSAAIIRQGIGVLEVIAGIVTLVDNFIINEKSSNISETKK